MENAPAPSKPSRWFGCETETLDGSPSRWSQHRSRNWVVEIRLISEEMIRVDDISTMMPRGSGGRAPPPRAAPAAAGHAWAQKGARVGIAGISTREAAGPRPEIGVAMRQVGSSMRPHDQAFRGEDEIGYRVLRRRRSVGRESRHSSASFPLSRHGSTESRTTARSADRAVPV